MLPISRDSRIKKEFYNVKYVFLPPVGDVELFLINPVEEEYTVEQMREAYNLAKKDIDSEFKGKKLPNKKKMTELLEVRTRLYLPQKSGNDVSLINETIDKILVGWEGLKDVKFPDDGRPSLNLPMALKTEMYTWYWSQYNLSEDEVKN
jgi:hypothetical protein